LQNNKNENEKQLRKNKYKFKLPDLLLLLYNTVRDMVVWDKMQQHVRFLEFSHLNYDLFATQCNNLYLHSKKALAEIEKNKKSDSIERKRKELLHTLHTNYGFL
jgi:hypothetical protein